MKKPDMSRESAPSSAFLEVDPVKRYATCTLVITTLNEERNVGRLLDSVAGQTVLPSEIVIVDAGSKDHTLEVIERFAATRKNLRITTYVEPGTIAHSRNFGIRRATYDKILSTDADCRLDYRFVELMAQYLDEYDVVGGTYDVVPQTWGEKVFNSRSRISWDEVDDLYVYPSMSIAFHRGVFNDVGGYDETLEASEDLDICLRWRKTPGVRLHLAHDVKLDHFLGRDYRTLLRISFNCVERDVSRGLATLGTPYWKMYVVAAMPFPILLAIITGQDWLTAIVAGVLASYLFVFFLRAAKRGVSPRLAAASTATELLVRLLQVAGVYSGLIKKALFLFRKPSDVPKKLG